MMHHRMIAAAVAIIHARSHLPPSVAYSTSWASSYLCQFDMQPLGKYKGHSGMQGRTRGKSHATG
eukprot:1153220-Pelagomonas_calceolata.AAC.4